MILTQILTLTLTRPICRRVGDEHVTGSGVEVPLPGDGGADVECLTFDDVVVGVVVRRLGDDD